MIWLSLFVLAGAWFWVMALYHWHRERRLRSHGLRAAGKVVRIDERADSEGDPLFLRVARFTASDGRAIEFTDSMPAREKELYRAGETVTVLYDPADCDHARIDPGGMRAGGVVLLFVMGLFFVMLACLGYRFQP